MLDTPWRMTRQRLAAVHAKARQKGLIDRHGDREMYEIVLHDIGVDSSKQFTREQYRQFMKHINTLPSVA